MELRQLHYFITIVNEGNISLAAKKLHISQPPLSHQMKLLETELGVTLFERGARNIRLTLPGKFFYEKALAILDLSALAKEEITNLEQEIRGVLRLGIISSATEIITRKFLSPFCSAYPGVTFDIWEANTFQLLEKISTNQIELAVVRTPFPRSGLDCFPLPADSFLAVGHPRFWTGMEELPEIPLSCLCEKGTPLILYKRWENPIHSYLDRLDLSSNIICRNEDARTSVLWAQEGLGVALIPESALYLTKDQKLIQKKLTEPCLNSSICLIKKKEKTLSIAADAFYKHFHP